MVGSPLLPFLRGVLSCSLKQKCRDNRKKKSSGEREMAKEEGTKCQRIGCDALFTPDNNPEGSCHYHSGPLFHDGGKEWSCCKQRSHDFSLFLSIPGCTTGKHTSEKPASKAAPSPNKSKQVSSGGNTSLNAAQAACIRCRQGFFCSDHGAKAGVAAAAQLSSQKLTSSEPIPKPVTPPVTKKASVPKVIDLNANQVCKHKGCGNTFTEKENHSTACHYHPGPAVFHDRSKGWACCDVHVKDFDEFLTIPTCATGWHDANATDSV